MPNCLPGLMCPRLLLLPVPFTRNTWTPFYFFWRCVHILLPISCLLTFLPMQYTWILPGRMLMPLCVILQVLQNLGKDKYPPQSLEQVGARIMKMLEKVIKAVVCLFVFFLSLILLIMSGVLESFGIPERLSCSPLPQPLCEPRSWQWPWTPFDLHWQLLQTTRLPMPLPGPCLSSGSSWVSEIQNTS